MNLLALRKLFVERSGRYDLVADYEGGDYTDNGANMFLQAAQRYLDLSNDPPEGPQESNLKVAIGDWQHNFPYLRRVEEVWMYTSADDRWRLTQKTISELMAIYTDRFEDLSTGKPAYFALALRAEPEQNIYADYAAAYTAAGLGAAAFDEDFETAVFNSAYDEVSLLTLPPAENAGNIKVIGHFWSKLTTDSDITYWTARYPELSLFSALMVMEVFYRNWQGVRDYQASVTHWLKKIDDDLVKQEIALAGNTMRG